MQFLRAIPGKHYFISIFIIGSALFATFSTVIYQKYSDAQSTNQGAIHYYENLRLTRRVLVTLLDMETSVRGYMLTRQQEFLDPYRATAPEFALRIEELKDTISQTSKNPERMDGFFNEALKFRDLLEYQIDAVRSNPLGVSTAEMLNNQKAAMDELRHSITVFTDEGLVELKKELDVIAKKEHEFFSLIVIGTILAIGAMLLATLLILSLMGRSLRAEQKTRAGEERFRRVMNGVNDGLYDYNLTDNTVYYSPAYKSMLGYSDSEHPDNIRTFYKLLHPDDIKEALDSFRRYKNRQSLTYNSVYRMLHKDGNWRWVLSRGVGMWDAAGHMLQIIGTHTDITEQKNSEEDLKQLNSDLETFAYIASHDLRSPLVNLKGFAAEMEYSLKESKPVIEKIEKILEPEDKETLDRAFNRDIPEALQFIKQSVDKMDMLTSAVLDLSRIGKREFRFEYVNTEAITERCLSTLAYEISQKEIEVSYSSVPSIITDSLAFEQILSNLLDNAVKYMVPGRKGKITIFHNMSKKDITFTIVDNGRGIAEQDRKKVFEIFRRARNSGDARGVGMGLAYVKATLRKLGGTIWFESKMDVGTSFHFRLPLTPLPHQNNERIKGDE